MNQLQFLKVFLFIIFISNLIGCKESSTYTLNKIIFERHKKVVIPESFKKEHLTYEKYNKIVESLPHCSEIVIVDEFGKSQSVLLREEGKISLTRPVWSHNGKKILFTRVDRQSKKYNIYMIDVNGVNGVNEVKLTNGNFNTLFPLFSPNDKKIAFLSDQTGKYEIYIMEIGKRDQYKLTDTNDGIIRTYRWSPNSKEIAFEVSRRILQMDKTGNLVEYENSDIYVIDIESKKLKKLTENSAEDMVFCWSPDGKEILYIADNPDNEDRPYWLSNGKKVTTCDFADKYEIYVMDKDGNNKRKLTNNSVSEHFPIWSPDGKKIAFISDGMLYLMDPDGKNQVKLTDKTQCYVSYGVWSPDSKKIAFVAEGDIYTIDIDGKNLKNLTNTPDWEEANPSWQPIPKD